MGDVKLPHGVLLKPLTRIQDERGEVMHMLRSDAPEFKRFGEVYFSKINFNAIKAWKHHSKMTQNLAVPIGNITIALFDGREKLTQNRDDKQTSTRKGIVTIDLGVDSSYSLLTIPPGIWYGFKGKSNPFALIANCADIPHSPSESQKLDHDNPRFSLDWKTL